MLMCTGIVDNLLFQAAGKGRDGNPYAASWRVQLKCDQPLPDGGVRRKFVELKTDHPEFFRDREGKPVSVPVGVMSGRGDPIFFLPKGWTPPAENAL
jgi:hypothetical protein